MAGVWVPAFRFVIQQEHTAMRTCLIIIGVIASAFISIIVILVVAGVVAVGPLLTLEAGGQQLVTLSVTAMAKAWNPQTLVDRADPKLKKELLKNNAATSAMYKKLGHLKRLDKPVGMVFSGISTQHGSQTIGRFSDVGHFSNGQANIHMNLILESKKWKISAFAISSDAFLPHLPAFPTITPATVPSLR